MRINQWYRILLFCVGLLSVGRIHAQSSFQYKALLGEVKSAGFYKITLSPELVASSKNKLNDIRILNDKNIQVPYILKSEQAEFQEKNFEEFAILDIRKEADKLTHVTIQSKLSNSIDELLLVIKNTDAERTVSLSGSDDQKRWFVIKENIQLTNLVTQQQDRFVQLISFPKSSYKFYELIINGKDLLPVNIVKVGVYQGTNKSGLFADVPPPVIVQRDSSDKHSYIDLLFNNSYLISKLQLEVSGPRFYRRNLTVQDADDFYHTSNSYLLTSETDRNYATNIKSKKITLVIENEDNPPLKVRAVKAYQLNKYLLAYLEPTVRYEIVFGDSTINAPKYDLDFFKDSLNNALPEIAVGSIIKVPSNKKDPGKPGGINMITLWIIIGSVLLLLLTLTFRMTKEIARKDKDGSQQNPPTT